MLLAYALAKMQYSPVNRLMRMLTAKTGVNSQSGDMDTIASASTTCLPTTNR